MTRCGIGPEFSVISVLSGILTGGLTYLYSDRLTILCIPYWFLAILGTGFLAAGTMVYVNALRTFNAGYKKGQLVTEGPYSVVRHPIYAAWILLICPGLVLFFRSWPMLFVPLIAYVSFKVSIPKEEDYLKEKYGQAYLDYRLRVNELFPTWKLWRGKI
jgi:protein-S-isoprenylcysteine O-methyltransferase Ste14